MMIAPTLDARRIDARPPRMAAGWMMAWAMAAALIAPGCGEDESSTSMGSNGTPSSNGMTSSNTNNGSTEQGAPPESTSWEVTAISVDGRPDIVGEAVERTLTPGSQGRWRLELAATGGQGAASMRVVVDPFDPDLFRYPPAQVELFELEPGVGGLTGCAATPEGDDGVTVELTVVDAETFGVNVRGKLTCEGDETLDFNGVVIIEESAGSAQAIEAARLEPGQTFWRLTPAEVDADAFDMIHGDQGERSQVDVEPDRDIIAETITLTQQGGDARVTVEIPRTSRAIDTQATADVSFDLPSAGYTGCQADQLQLSYARNTDEVVSGTTLLAEAACAEGPTPTLQFLLDLVHRAP